MTLIFIGFQTDREEEQNIPITIGRLRKKQLLEEQGQKINSDFLVGLNLGIFLAMLKFSDICELAGCT